MEETRQRLDGYLSSYPGLRGRVCRILLLHLHSKGLVRIDEVYRRAARAEEWNRPVDPNRPSSRLWAAEEKEAIHRMVIDLASDHLTPEEVEEVVWAAHRRDEAQSLEVLARMPDVPLELVAEKVAQYASLPGEEEDGGAGEGTRVALIRRFISDRVDYIRIAKRALTIGDLAWMLERAVGTAEGSGFVGGKAAGMLLAAAILRESGRCGDVRVPETAFLLTDAYDALKEHNGLQHLQDQKYKPIDEIRRDFPAIREILGNAEFPPRIVDLLRATLDRWQRVPLVVRSSSLLEDSFGAAFSGIYHSIFLPNQGGLEDRLRELLGAISEVYSGIFSPDALSYRRRHDLLDADERMAAMVQPVVGTRHGRFFMPAVAGVAFSRNDYRWSERIRREDGLVRMVLGLGTHAVDRVGDYARMVPLAVPTLRPEGTPGEIARTSQKQVDVVDLEGGGFRSVPSTEALAAMREGGIADYVSVIGPDGALAPPLGTRVDAPEERLCLTFDRLLSRGDFVTRIATILKTLEEGYRLPVDVEFAMDRGEMFLTQCRPLAPDRAGAGVPVPKDIPAEDRIFSASRYVNAGSIEEIRYVVLIDPRDYGRLESVDRKLLVARTVGHLNDALHDESFILMGPGRWGSKEIRLGVQVSYGDICHAKALIEIARADHGYTPEPSFGTHFFQDLIEGRILYLPLYPDAPGADFHEGFLLRSENALPLVLPHESAMADVVRLIDVARAAPGRKLSLAMDAEAQRALCFLR